MSDRKKAIETLKQLRLDYEEFYEEHSNEVTQAYDMAIASLETDEAYQLEYERTTKDDLANDVPDNNVGNIDCISRADAIGSIAVECSAENLDIDYAKFLMLRRAIKALPAVIPQEPRWIPVSERMPEKTGMYLISIGDLVTSKSFDGHNFRTESAVRFMPDAWMPLPEPFESQESEE